MDLQGYLSVYIKQHKPMRDSRETFYSFHFRWLGPSNVNMTASEVGTALQMSTYDIKRKAWNWKKYACQVPYYPRNPIWIWVPRPWSRIESSLLIECIRCDSLSTVVIKGKAQPDKYEKDFDAFLTQYIHKQGPTSSEKTVSIAHTRPVK